MKRYGTMLVAIVALGLVTASSALADVRAPSNASWTGVAPANASWTGVAPANATWTGIAPAGSKAWGSRGWDVRNGSRTWDVRKPFQAKGWGARGWGSRTWDVRQGKRPADVRLHADWTWRATRAATKGWSDGS